MRIRSLHSVALLTLLVAAGTLLGCNKRKGYPDTHPGWHNASYTVVFGRLLRVPGPTPDAPPAWTLRFGEVNDAYSGEFALTPPERFVGYTGGERVEVHGHVLAQDTNDLYNGRWYVVDSIRMWQPFK